MNSSQLQGVFTALVTPFKHGTICYESLERLLAYQLASDVKGLVVLGTTGEAPTISKGEQEPLLRFVRERTEGRLPMIVGATSNATLQALELVRQAEQANADGILIAAPYYNKPSQEGLYQHFGAVARSTEKPIVIYSHPGRCGVGVDVDTLARLHGDYPNIMAIKETGGCCDKVSEIRVKLGDGFRILSGDDPLTLPFMSLGGCGVISATANLVPAQMCEMVQLALDNNFVEASKKNKILTALYKALFIESNPIPVKYALYRKGLIGSAEMRLPLVEMSQEHCKYVDGVIERIQLRELCH